MYMTESVANYFIKGYRSGEINSLSPMKLQKLLFISQCWYLQLYNEFLVEDGFSMWQHGPVIPAIYHKTSHYKEKNIEDYIRQVFKGEISHYHIPEHDKQVKDFLNKIAEVYGSLRGSQLAYLILNNTECPPESHPFERKHIGTFVINIEKKRLSKECKVYAPNSLVKRL